MEVSGCIPPPIKYYHSGVYITSGGYLPYFKLLRCFYFSAVVNVIKKSVINLTEEVL